MKRDGEFSTAKGREILKNESDLRVSEDASENLVDELETLGSEIAAEAWELAQEDGLKTVRKGHVKQAVRNLN